MTLEQLTELTELIDLIYTAAVDPDLWPEVLHTLAANLGCDSAAMRIVDLQDLKVVAEVVSPSPAAHAADYASHFDHIAPWLDKLKVNGADAYMVVMHGEEVTQSELLAHCEPQDGKGGIVGFMFKVAGRIVHIALDYRQPVPGVRFIETLGLLAPHLQRSMLVSRQRSELERRVDSMEQAINRFGTGVILIDGRGQPAFLNRQAHAVVSENRALKVAAGQLAGGSAPDTRDLRQLVMNAVEQGQNGGHRLGAMTMHYGNDGKVRLSIVAVPLHPAIHSLAHEPAIYAALLIGSIDFAAGLDPAVLQLLYNLTGAEARLAVGLSMGKSLEQYCDENSIRISTARSYLKQVFQKTSTNRQTELVCLLRSIPFDLKA